MKNAEELLAALSGGTNPVLHAAEKWVEENITPNEKSLAAGARIAFVANSANAANPPIDRDVSKEAVRMIKAAGYRVRMLVDDAAHFEGFTVRV